MTLPFSGGPSSLAFVDDDIDYLKMLASLIPAGWHVRLFSRPADCARVLREEMSAWDEDVWHQQQIIDRWRRDTMPLIPQILTYWSCQAPVRYGLTRACVADYSMPDLDGLQMLAQLGNWPGLRMLLTGQADEQIAVNAFNRTLIDQFLPKQAPDVAERLLRVLHHLPSVAEKRCSQIWRSTLSPEQHAQLTVPSMARALSSLLASQGFVEYVILGEPYGVLGRKADGAVSWVQLEPLEGLAELAFLAAECGLDRTALETIGQGRQLPDMGPGPALAPGSVPQLRHAFRVVEDAPLLAAVFSVERNLIPTHGSGYSAWLSAQPARHVRT